MTKAVPIVLNADDALHPGEMLAEYLDHYGWSQNDLARRTGLTSKTVSEIRNGKAPISTQTALVLERVFERPAHFWLRLQSQYDEAVARASARERAEDWRAWASNFPLRAMREWMLIGAPREGETDAEQLLRFFGVSSPESFQEVWSAARVSFRQTIHANASDQSVSAWVRATEIAAQQLEWPVAEFSEAKLRDAIPQLCALTLKRADSNMEPVQQICCAAGVAVVWIPELPGCSISGCARWLTRSKALIGLTLRYKTDDQMWFTFFHEIGHILLHRRSNAFVLDNGESVNTFVLDNGTSILAGPVDPEMQRREEEANRFAADTLLPPAELSRFVRDHPTISNEAVHAFSQHLGIAPGIIVGRLQRDKVLDWHQGNAFKQKLNFAVRMVDDG